MSSPLGNQASHDATEASSSKSPYGSACVEDDDQAPYNAATDHEQDQELLDDDPLNEDSSTKCVVLYLLPSHLTLSNMLLTAYRSSAS